MQPTDPTQTQLDARLNPTPVQYNTPGNPGLFRTAGGGDNTVFSYDPTTKQLSQFSLGTLGRQSILADRQAQGLSADPSGVNGEFNGMDNVTFASRGTSIFKSQYGVDYASLPVYNLADIQSGMPSTTDANGARNFSQNTIGYGSAADFLKAIGTGTPTPQSNTINNTPNSLAAGITQTSAPASYNGSSNVQAPTTALQPGSTDTTNVKALQDYLVSKGFMTQAQVNTGYGIYGPQTTAAVAALQKSLGVDNSSGPGYFGPRTLAALATQGQAPQYNAPSAIGSGVMGTTGGTPYTQPNPSTNPATSLNGIAQTLQNAVTQAENAPLGQNEQDISSLIKQTMALNDQEAGKAAYQEQQDTAAGVPAAQAAVTDLTSQLQAIVNQHIAAQLATQQGEGVTTAVDTRQRDEETRQNAIKALSIKTLLDAAQGNLTTAQANADRAVALKFAPIEARITAATNNINLLKNDPETSREDKARADTISAALDNQKQALDAAKTAYAAVQKVAVDAASYLNSFVPSAQFKTASQALQAIQNAPDPVTAQMIATQSGLTAPTVKNGTWSTPYMLGGSYVQKNDTTGEIRTAVNPPNAPQATLTEKENASIGTALTDAQEAISKGADPTAVRKAYLSKHPTGATQWDAYFADANKPNASGDAQAIYPTPAPAQTTSTGFNLFNPSTW